jgi:chaperonin GroEL (HSP60 family)
MEVTQPAAKMLVELSKSQDIVAGDGTTTGQTLHFELQATCAFEVSFEYQWAVLLLCHGLL